MMKLCKDSPCGCKTQHEPTSDELLKPVWKCLNCGKISPRRVRSWEPITDFGKYDFDKVAGSETEKQKPPLTPEEKRSLLDEIDSLRRRIEYLTADLQELEERLVEVREDEDPA